MCHGHYFLWPKILDDGPLHWEPWLMSQHLALKSYKIMHRCAYAVLFSQYMRVPLSHLILAILIAQGAQGEQRLKPVLKACASPRCQSGSPLCRALRPVLLLQW